jgi:hypothetical protein
MPIYGVRIILLFSFIITVATATAKQGNSSQTEREHVFKYEVNLLSVHTVCTGTKMGLSQYSIQTMG